MHSPGWASVMTYLLKSPYTSGLLWIKFHLASSIRSTHFTPFRFTCFSSKCGPCVCTRLEKRPISLQKILLTKIRKMRKESLSHIHTFKLILTLFRIEKRQKSLLQRLVCRSVGRSNSNFFRNKVFSVIFKVG